MDYHFIILRSFYLKYTRIDIRMIIQNRPEEGRQ